MKMRVYKMLKLGSRNFHGECSLFLYPSQSLDVHPIFNFHHVSRFLLLAQLSSWWMRRSIGHSTANCFTLV